MTHSIIYHLAELWELLPVSNFVSFFFHSTILCIRAPSTFLRPMPLLSKYQDHKRNYDLNLSSIFFWFYAVNDLLLILNLLLSTITEKNVPALKAVTPRMKFAVTGAGTAVGVLGALTYAMAQENYTLGYITDYIRHQFYDAKEKLFGQENQ